MRLKLVSADFHAVDLEGALDVGGRGHSQAEEVFALVRDNEGEVNPLAPRQGLDFTTLVVSDAFLDGGQVGEVDACSEHARGGLFENHAFGLSLGLGVALEGHAGELALAGQEGGEGVAGVSGVRHIGAGVVGERSVVRGSAVLHTNIRYYYLPLAKHILTRKSK